MIEAIENSTTTFVPPFFVPRELKVPKDGAKKIKIPSSVVKKFEVKQVSGKIEDLILNKIKDEAFEEEAFYFIDLGTVLRKYREWIQHLPRVKPFYAMKCNPNLAIMKTLASLGVNFDCASKNEMAAVLGLGVHPSRIIYANPTKMKSHIHFARENKVEMMTFDNADELRKCAEIFPDAKLVLRIITDDSRSVCKFSTKFGAPLNQVPGLLQLAKDLNLNIIGVSFHVGSGCMSALSFADAIRNAHEVFVEAEKYGFKFNFLDLGGGWPGSDDDGINFGEIADYIAPLLDEFFPADVEIIAEPGRYFVAESHTLAVNVFAKRQQIATDGDKSYLYYINDGVYQSFNCIFFDHINPKPLVLVPGERKDTHKCTIFGPTCDSMDCISKDIMLPELEVGEWLYFKCMGAYTVAAASNFNGFKNMPNTYYIEQLEDM